jgi:hypothetical protein
VRTAQRRAAARKHRRGIDGDQKRELKPYEIRKDAVSVRRDINRGRSAQNEEGGDDEDFF